MSSSRFDPEALLRLCSIPRIGSTRIRALMARFGSPANVLKAPHRQLTQVDGIDTTLARYIRKGGDQTFAREQMKRLGQTGALLKSLWDDHYPPLLKRIASPPVLLWVLGDPKSLIQQGIAVVGTRMPTSYGKLMAENLTLEMVREPLAIVSGLARGVDTIVHRTVVDRGGCTVAVLGSGVDIIYPQENQKIAKRIAEKGALLSEFPLGSKPEATNFPRRNRIIAGMTLGTLVIEAGEKSGALITAEYALEQNREVFAVPGHINNPKCAGCNLLIQEGAKLVRKVDDIFEEINGLSLSAHHKQQDIPLSGIEKRIYDQLNYEPQHIDIIARSCNLSTHEILSVLLSLELKNLIRQMAGKNFLRI